MTVFYLAARYTRRLEMCGYREQLQAIGHKVPARWLDGSHQLDVSGTPIGDMGELLIESGDDAKAAALREKFAVEDMADVLSADELIAFTEQPRVSNSRGGRHVELGMALAIGKPVTIVGPRENVFCWLPQVRHFENWEQAYGGLL